MRVSELIQKLQEIEDNGGGEAIVKTATDGRRRTESESTIRYFSVNTDLLVLGI